MTIYKLKCIKIHGKAHSHCRNEYFGCSANEVCPRILWLESKYTHFESIFAPFTSMTDKGYSCLLLSLSPFKDEEDQTADDQ